MKTILGLAAILAIASVAWAQSPHFIGTAQVAGVFSDGGISASFKEAGLGDVGAIATFQSSKNGNVVGTVTFVPPAASAELSCPGSQVAVLADISYSDLTLQDVTNGDFATLDKVALSA